GPRSSAQACAQAICWWQAKGQRTRSLSAAAPHALSAGSPTGPRWLMPRDTSSSRDLAGHRPLGLLRGSPARRLGAGALFGGIRECSPPEADSVDRGSLLRTKNLARLGAQPTRCGCLPIAQVGSAAIRLDLPAAA